MNSRDSYGELVRATERELSSPEGIKIQKSRREAIRRVAATSPYWNAARADWPLRTRKGVWFSITQTRTIRGTADGVTLSVQMLGAEVGKLDVDLQSENRYVFRPRGLKNTKWEWSRNPKHAALIRRFLDIRRVSLHQRNVQEREVQWQLAKKIQTDKTDALRGLSLVMWFGVPTEVGACLTRTGRAGVGNVDLLARGRGGRSGARFFVLELKRPGHAGVHLAMKQAIGYALALQKEANLDEGTRRSYRRAFRSKGDAPLRFQPVVVVENDPRAIAEVQKSLKEYRSPGTTHGRLVPYVLLYEWLRDGKIGVLTWLDNRRP